MIKWLVKIDALKAVCFALIFSTGCAQIPVDQNPIPLYRGEATIPRAVAAPLRLQLDMHKDQSGFYVIDRNDDAFLSRVALLDFAEKTIDLQYYIWHNDKSGKYIMNKLIQAANRGVRVRLLIDDTASWEKDEALAAINQHQNIYIKLFNPLGGRYANSRMRTLALIGNFSRINHRMHNKVMVIDNQIAIVGGRNIGDEYFGVHRRRNFRDLDLLVLGNIVNDISKMFDEFWNSKWSLRSELLIKHRYSEGDFKKRIARFVKGTRRYEHFLYHQYLNSEALKKIIVQMIETSIWAKSEVISDSPEKVLTNDTTPIFNKVTELASAAEKEIIFSAPYLIPTVGMLAAADTLRQKGVKIYALTNSMKSNDVLIAQYGYASRRKELLLKEIQLFELRSDAQSREIYIAPPFRNAKLSLHAKVVLVDRKYVLIGSFNMDPRSISINTEMGIVIYSEALANKIYDGLRVEMQLNNSFQPYLIRRWKIQGNDMYNDNNDESNEGTEKYYYSIGWRTEHQGRVKEYSIEPNSGFFHKIGQMLYSLLPIEDQL